jgi:hypothetical protein
MSSYEQNPRASRTNGDAHDPRGLPLVVVQRQKLGVGIRARVRKTARTRDTCMAQAPIRPLFLDTSGRSLVLGARSTARGYSGPSRGGCETRRECVAPQRARLPARERLETWAMVYSGVDLAGGIAGYAVAMQNGMDLHEPSSPSHRLIRDMLGDT